MELQAPVVSPMTKAGGLIAALTDQVFTLGSMTFSVRAWSALLTFPNSAMTTSMNNTNDKKEGDIGINLVTC